MYINITWLTSFLAPPPFTPDPHVSHFLGYSKLKRHASFCTSFCLCSSSVAVCYGIFVSVYTASFLTTTLRESTTPQALWLVNSMLTSAGRVLACRVAFYCRVGGYSDWLTWWFVQSVALRSKDKSHEWRPRTLILKADARQLITRCISNHINDRQFTTILLHSLPQWCDH